MNLAVFLIALPIIEIENLLILDFPKSQIRENLNTLSSGFTVLYYVIMSVLHLIRIMP